MISKTAGFLCVAVCVVLLAAAPAFSYMVDAFSNSSSGGTGVNTGITLTAGQQVTVSASPTDLWSAGVLPRWSNADGLVGNLLATGTDESGESAGTLIGQNFPLWTQSGLTAPYGALVGSIDGTFFLLGTSFNGTAPATGILNLWYWDENYGDNSGSINAAVNVVPIPAAAWLLGTGVIGLVALRRRFRG